MSVIHFLESDAGLVIVRDRGIVGVSDQDHGQFTSQSPEGIDVFCPQLLPRLVDRREVFVRVEISFAQSGEVFAGTDDVGGAQSCEKFAGVEYRLFRIGRNGARSHHCFRGFEGEVDDRREVGVESQRPAGCRRSVCHACGKACGRRWRRRRRRREFGRMRLRKRSTRATFHVHGSEERRGDAGLAVLAAACRFALRR